MAKYFIEDTTLTNIANAIRTKTGSTDVIKTSDIALKIEQISSEAEPVLQEKSVTPSESVQTVEPDAGYDALSSVIVDAISQTYVGSSVDRVEATTIVPTTTSQIAVHAGSYVTGNIEVAAVEVENLDAEISEQDSLIEQIQTALEGKVTPSGGIDTSDATATESDIASGKTAYVKGVKITGTHECSGGGEGTNFETGEILITNESTNSCFISATVLNSGVISSIHEMISTGESMTILNVLLDSTYVFYDRSATATNKLYEEDIRLNTFQDGHYIGVVYGSSIPLRYE